MSDQICVKIYDNFKTNFESSKISKMESFSYRGDLFCFISGDDIPFIGSKKQKTIIKLNPGNKITKTKVKCARISYDGKVVVTIQDNNCISIWDLETKTFFREFPLQMASGLKGIACGATTYKFYSIDDSDTLYEFDLTGRFSISLTEKPLMNFDTKIIYMESKIEDIIIFASDKEIFSLNVKQLALKSVFKTERALTPKIYQHLNSQNAFLMIVDTSEIYIYKLTKNGDFSHVNNVQFETNIRTLIFLKNDITAVLLSSGGVCIVNRGFNITQIYTAKDFIKLYKTHPGLFGYGENIYLFNGEEMLEASFPTWKDSLTRLKERRDWTKFFSTAITIYSGASIDFFGIPDFPSERCKQVSDFSADVFPLALEDTNENESQLAWILTTARTLSMPEFAFGCALPFYEKRNSVFFFLDVILSRVGSIYSQMMPTPLIEKFIETAAVCDRLKYAEETLLLADFTPAQSAEVLEMAKKFKLLKLIKNIAIKVFNDILTPTRAYWEAGKISKFAKSIFIKSKFYIAKPLKDTLLFWLCTPTDGQFNRMLTTLSGDWQLAPFFFTSFMSLCPIKQCCGSELNTPMIVDLIMRTIECVPYEDAEPLLESVFSLCVAHNQEIPLHALKLAVRWVFTGKSWTAPREALLRKAAEQYPDLIKIESFMPYIKAAGLINLINDQSDPKVVLRTLVMNRETRATIFEYANRSLQKCHDETIEAIKEHFSVFVLVNPEEAVSLLATEMPDFHEVFLSTCHLTLCKWMYLKALMNSKASALLTPDDMLIVFRLICMYEPAGAIQFLSDHPSVPLDQALEVCRRFRVIPVSVHIYNILGQIQSAISLLASENERILVRLLQSKKTLIVASADRISEEPLLIPALENIDHLLEVIDKVPTQQDIIGPVWKNVFRSFELPIWLSQTQSDAQTKKAIALFFAYFIIEALGKTSTDLVFDILRSEFKTMDNTQYRNIFQFLIGFLEYRRKLAHAVESIHMEDCYRLLDAADLARVGGLYVDTPVCAACGLQIKAGGAVGMQVFGCGHCFHNNAACGGRPRCIICSGEAEAKEAEDESMIAKVAPQKRSVGATRIKVRLLQRVENGLRSNYGKTTGSGYNGNSVFFFPGEQVANPTVKTLNPVLDLPPPTPVFLGFM